MKSSLFLMSLAVATGAVLILPSPSAAQTAPGTTTEWTCKNASGGAPEALGDREGHVLVTKEFTCQVDSGPLVGGALQGGDTYEFDGPKGNMLAFSFIVRKPGAVVVAHATEGNQLLTIADGKVTGVKGSGRYDYVLATGPWAPLGGKSETWEVKTAGPEGFTIESKLQ